MLRYIESFVLTLMRGREQAVTSMQRYGASLAGPGLLLSGEPGIGTSKLLRVVEAGAREAGVRVVTLTALPERADRPLRILNEMLTALNQHAEIDSDSLEEMVEEALAAAACEQPTLLVIDEADHLDAMSWEALTRAARLLQNAPFALVGALSMSGSARARESGLPVLTVGPINREASEAVLDDVAPTLPKFIRYRILDASAGNPLALRELASAPREEWQRRCVRPPVALPLTPRLTSAFANLLQELPRATQEVMLAAAANDSQSLTEAVRAAAITLKTSVESTLAACLPAVQQGLVQSDSSTLRFRSEVARSAIYQAASPARRRDLHLAFTQVLSETPARRAWHRAAATLEPDEPLAKELETAATSARNHGRFIEAVAFMDRAARVSELPAARTERLLRLASMGFEIGRPDLVTAFTEQASGLAETSDQRRQVASIRGLYDAYRPDGPSAVLELLELAERAAGADDRATTRMVVTRINEKLGGLRPSQVPREELIASAQRLGGLRATPALAGPLALALPAEYGREILELVATTSPDADGDPRLARVLGAAAMTLGDEATAVCFFNTAIDRMRLEGRLGILPFALLDRARAYISTARLALARSDAAEAIDLARESAQPVVVCKARALQALIEGLAGNFDAGRSATEEAEPLAVDRPALQVDLLIARGLTALSCADYEDAYASLIQLWDPAASLLAIGRRRSHIGDLAEAARACGESARVKLLVEELAITSCAAPSPALRAGVTHARAVLSPSSEQAELFVEAREAATELGPLVIGRIRLSYGIWLRRNRQVNEARLELRSALAAFESAGAHPWSDRARSELRAAGAAVTSTSPDNEELTVQERQIAELAAAGMTNREIGQRLYLSHRTVSTHLYHVFPKLGITSRTKLRDVLIDYAEDEAKQHAVHS